MDLSERMTHAQRGAETALERLGRQVNLVLEGVRGVETHQELERLTYDLLTECRRVATHITRLAVLCEVADDCDGAEEENLAGDRESGLLDHT